MKINLIEVENKVANTTVVVQMASGSGLDVVALRLLADQLRAAAGEGASHVRGDFAFFRWHEIVPTATETGNLGNGNL